MARLRPTLFSELCVVFISRGKSDWHWLRGFCWSSFAPATVSTTSSQNNFGTFGQYSVGVNLQIPNTGWLAFARADLREGSDIRGFDVTGGVRYQFSDVASVAPELPTRKGPPPVVGGVNWTGFYLGGFGGADAGWSRLGFSNVGFGPGTATVNPRGFLGGGEAGYNYQLGNLVLGAEGDFGGDTLKGSKACAPLVANTFVHECPPVQHDMQ